MTMEGGYLTSTVATPLTQCLKEVVEVRPRDPIEWIAHWLYRYTDSQLYFMEKKEEFEAMQEAYEDLERTRARKYARRCCLRAKIKITRNELRKNDVALGRRSTFEVGSLSTVSMRDFDMCSLDEGPTDSSMDLRRHTKHGSDDMEYALRRSRGDSARPSQKDPQMLNAKHRGYPSGAKDEDRSTGKVSIEASSSRKGQSNSKASRKGSFSTQHSGESTRKGETEMGGKGKGKKGASDKSLDGYIAAQENEMAARGWDKHFNDPYDPNKARWRLNCQWGLICEHPVLGSMQPRPPLVYPETPEWWQRQGYIKETLYDHEIYSRDNKDNYPGWDKMEHMTYKDFVQEGPWLSEGALQHMQPSLKNLYNIANDDKNNATNTTTSTSDDDHKKKKKNIVKRLP